MQIGLMLDCSRNAVMTISMIKKFIDIMKKMGYTSLQLYTEDTYEVEKEPMLGYLRGKFTKDELKEIDAYAKSRSVELIPCVQVLAHIKGIFRHWEYKEINDIDDILLVGDERTYRLIEHIFQTLAECFSSRRVNIGMDEAYLLGRGKFSDEHGFPKKFDILLSHLKKVSEIANKYGFHPMMWSDMFFRPVNDGDYYGKNYGMNSVPENIRKKVPENIELVYWEYFQTESKYYDRMIERHKEFDKPFYYAGGVSCWTGFVPNNRYAIETLRAAVHSCQKYGEVRKRRKSTLWDMIFQKNGRATEKIIGINVRVATR